jgi:sugar-specific transcriptional regulator TrmB
MEVDELSLERIIKALVSLGLSQTDAEVYIHIATKGAETARKISNNLSINRRQIYRSLKGLKNKGIVMINSEIPSEFSALPFEKVVDILLELKHNQAKSLEESKAAIISDFLTEKKKS